MISITNFLKASNCHRIGIINASKTQIILINRLLTKLTVHGLSTQLILARFEQNTFNRVRNEYIFNLKSFSDFKKLLNFFLRAFVRSSLLAASVCRQTRLYASIAF